MKLNDIIVSLPHTAVGDCIHLDVLKQMLDVLPSHLEKLAAIPPARKDGKTATTRKISVLVDQTITGKISAYYMHDFYPTRPGSPEDATHRTYVIDDKGNLKQES